MFESRVDGLDWNKLLTLHVSSDCGGKPVERILCNQFTLNHMEEELSCKSCSTTNRIVRHLLPFLVTLIAITSLFDTPKLSITRCNRIQPPLDAEILNQSGDCLPVCGSRGFFHITSAVNVLLKERSQDYWPTVICRWFNQISLQQLGPNVWADGPEPVCRIDIGSDPSGLCRQQMFHVPLNGVCLTLREAAQPNRSFSLIEAVERNPETVPSRCLSEILAIPCSPFTRYSP
ncbi:MAG: hypothetical protein ACKVHE_24710 [Planctomycetales bacterium]